MLKSVVSDYTKTLTKDISQTGDQIVSLYQKYNSSDTSDKQKETIYGQLQTLWKKQSDDISKLTQLNSLK